MTSPRPVRDEIILSALEGRPPCNSLTCANAGRIAQVTITFGTLADPGSGPHSKDALWAESWGCSYPMRAPCREGTRQVAREHRPNLVIPLASTPGTTIQPAAGPELLRRVLDGLKRL